MAQTVEIRGNFDKQDGATAVSGKIYFTLNKRDYDGDTIIEPMEQSVDLGADGSFSGLMVWPNDRGRLGSRYKVEFSADGGKGRALIEGNLLVPETGSPHQLADLVFATTVAASTKVYGLIPIKAAEYDAKLAAGKLTEGAIYLVEAA